MKKWYLPLFLVLFTLVLQACNNDDHEVSDKFEQLSFKESKLQCSGAKNTLETSLNFGDWYIRYYTVVESGDTVVYENPIKNDGMVNYYDNTITGEWFTIKKEGKDGRKINIQVTENMTGEKRELIIFCEGALLFGAELKVTQE